MSSENGTDKADKVLKILQDGEGLSKEMADLYKELESGKLSGKEAEKRVGELCRRSKQKNKALREAIKDLRK